MATSGQTTVASAGTEVKLATDQPCDAVLIKAFSTNSGLVYVGNDGAGAVSSSTGYPLAAGQEVYIEIANLNSVFVDAASNGDKVGWILVKP